MQSSHKEGGYGEFLNILERSSELLTEDTQREELFSLEHLESYATHLATEFKIRTRPKKARSLLPEVKKAKKKLQSAYKNLAQAIQEKKPVSPAAEWFVDNFHVIESQLKEIQLSLPEGYYQGLPQLADGPLEGYPRVYALALAIIGHTDSRLDSHLLHRVLVAFQKVSPLQIGEIWALVISLRIVLVQNLTPRAIRIVSARDKRQEADTLADKILAAAVKEGASEKALTEILRNELGTAKDFSRSHIVQLIQRLRDQEPDVWPAFDWIEKQLQSVSASTQQVAQLEYHRQAAAQVTIGNILSSMRLLSNMNWRDFFEMVHVGEKILKQDPSGHYARMDFQTRDQYRHAVERISKKSKASETEVANSAIALANAHPAGSRARHVGYYLLGDGQSELETSVHYKGPLNETIFRWIRRQPTPVYLGGLLFFTALILYPIVYNLWKDHVAPLGVITFSILAAFPASEIAISLLNQYVHFFFKPKALARMDLEKGIPDKDATIVAIPTLFTSPDSVQELVDRLEIHSLANPETSLHFALLSDFADANQETMPNDDALLKVAQDGLALLNARYCADSQPRFHLFHRRRQWNPSEGKWIGWERKRGKLLEFNKVLRGETTTSYVILPKIMTELQRIQYVVALDSDTTLPRDAVQKLVGTITHPLNVPLYDHQSGRVTSGYGVLQPRISITSSSANATRFAQISSGNIGLDPYTTAVSDMYQDLFQEGTFTGKGLYVIDAFETAMEGRVPENRVLSHDLFEGSFARTALVTDVELFDDYPSDYDKFSKRNHRWTRGDWQIIPWLLSKAPTSSGRRERNPLPLIAKWKIFDNLRRSLVPVMTILWLIMAWTILPGSAITWSALIALMYLFPVYSTVITGDWMSLHGLTWRGYFVGGLKETEMKINQIFVTVAFLPQQAWTSVDAILRAGYRMFISKKHLLEWMTHAQMESYKKSSSWWADFFSPGPVFALLIGIAAFKEHPKGFEIAVPFLVLWLGNPFLKSWLAQRPLQKKIPLGREEQIEYRSFARGTWHFFETFVGDSGNWLAPDNFQEDPKPVVAHRTSPTNVGLQLLSYISAYDLGYIGHYELIEKMEKTFVSLDRMDRLRGHFFNWYDTSTLQPLNPRYVSAVDSGNLAGHLLTFQQFMLELADQPRTLRQISNGLVDTLVQMRSEVRDQAAEQDFGSHDGDLKELGSIFENLIEMLVENENAERPQFDKILSEVSGRLHDAKKIVADISIDRNHDLTALEDWTATGLRQIFEMLRDERLGVGKLRHRELALAKQCDDIVAAMDFRFLYDDKRKLFVIGHNVAEDRHDNSNYDLLASESRLGSFVAIAKGDVPSEHWFRLGRKMAPVKGGRALIAWTATMFEYLMPVLVMKDFENTLLSQTYDAIVRRQIEYGNERHVPWGVSEAGFNARDLQMNYQYGPFGVPGLGLKRGLSDELVISPYSSFLAAQIDPWSALENLQRLALLGARGRYGFYEALDYTPERVPKSQKFALLKSFMAHHQGMSLVAVNNLLGHNRVQKRFHANPMIQATELLLQERIPKAVAISQPRAEEIRRGGFLHLFVDHTPRSYSAVSLNLPRTQLLSNGTYSVLLTSTGAGYSRCGKLAVTRWREDATRNHWGQFFYVRDRQTDLTWSATHQTAGLEPQSFEAIFAEDKVEFVRRDLGALTKTEILVSPEDNVELRKISITNESREVREYEITSFMEIVLSKPEDDNAHPAFNNLFVQTEKIANGHGLLATRRARSRKESPPWGFHVIATDAQTMGPPEHETDRLKFLGRGRAAQNPWAIEENRPLSNTTGSVLDPIFSLRQVIRVQPGETGEITFATGLAPTREAVEKLVDKYRDTRIFARESEIAWTQSQVQLRHFNISVAEAHTFQKLAGRVLYLDFSLRPSSQVLSGNSRTQSSLWAYGLSGDLPIILTRISDEDNMLMVRELLRAHEYFRFKGLAVDLVILNERSTSYLQSLQDELTRQVRMSGSQALLDKPGGVFLRRTDLMAPEDVTLLRSVARVTLNADRGTLAEQLRHRKPQSELPALLVGTGLKDKTLPVKKPLRPDLNYFNGLGGFSKDAREYIVHLQGAKTTPAPWCNVIANESDFGFLISESGSSYTWCMNSRENRLTPWSNDPVSDPSGEVIYLRDEETGEFWSPTPLPIREPEAYVIAHGQGFTRFEHASHGLEQVLEVFVALEANVKISRLKLKNVSGKSRKISVTSYVEWVLGFQKAATSPFVIPEIDTASGMLMARNPYNNEFSNQVAFLDISETNRTYTCDRQEFIGRNGSLRDPAALKRVSLGGSSGAGLDPCAAFQSAFSLAAGEEKTVIVVLGEASNMTEARILAHKYSVPATADRAFKDVQNFWNKTLSTIEIKTPDQSMDTLVNRWLPYQNLACRVWGRSAFYQSGGAFGFRDQLQDVMAVAYAQPKLARDHILKAAARQFPEGDVQHWWHPPTGRGVRTRFSDDLIWLPFVVSFYMKITGDVGILKEQIPFIVGPELPEGIDDLYNQPHTTDEKYSLFEHCARTLDRSLKVGEHGLPLMGSGDWNDGMSRVGHEGKGESVWVAWFLYAALEQFIPVCEKNGDTKRVAIYQQHLIDLKFAIEKNAWDGEWYRRAYFDDGTPLGSAQNEECRIDSIAQSWSVISRAGDPDRRQQAMRSLEKYLIRKDDGLIQLFTPPFDKTPMDPGYIKGYLPGVRENGGQYTHAAIWAVMAYAEMGDGDRAASLYAMLNPINHALDAAATAKYKVEPYVMAADIYGMAPHIGRGGWTWYTGSASWMYRAAIESILGFDLQGDRFRMNPNIPSSWNEFTLNYRFGNTNYRIHVSRVFTKGAQSDGKIESGEWVSLVDDGQDHIIEIGIPLSVQ